MKIIKYTKARIFHIIRKEKYYKKEIKDNYFYDMKTKPWKRIINKKIRQK